MYSPTTRLLTILELLQSHQQMSGSELARRLEVDTRTIRRYITMLQDMGIPVEAERGVYGAYQLQRGYKLPPLMFTDSEAIALTLALLAIRELHFPVDVAAVEGALAKTERVMPEKLLQQARGLQEAITFYATPPPQLNQHVLARLSLAVQQRQRVFMSYESYEGTTTEREFDPYGIVFNEGYWYAAGYCHLRQGIRTFRLDRIHELAPRKDSFTRPKDFDALDYVLNSVAAGSSGTQIEVLLETSLDHAREVIPPHMATLEEIDGGVLFRRAPYEVNWVALFLLNLDFPAKVIHTDELRERMRQIGMRAIQILER